MEEVGIVSSTDGVHAKVIVARKGVCEQCSIGACRMTGEGMEIEALNVAGARVGQKVKVVLKTYSYLKGSLVLYGLPALALTIGAVVGKEYLSRFLPGMDPDGVAAISAFSLLALSFIFIKLWGVRAERKIQYKSIIEEILDKNEEKLGRGANG